MAIGVWSNVVSVGLAYVKYEVNVCLKMMTQPDYDDLSGHNDNHYGPTFSRKLFTIITLI